MGRRKEKITSKFGIATADFFREKRMSLGLTQTELSILIFDREDRQNLISDIENHMKRMNSEIIDKYCEALNCSVNFIENPDN